MQSTTIYCSSCGAGNRSQATFCYSCGQKMLIGIPPPSFPLNVPSVGGTGRLSSQHVLHQRYIVVRLLGQGGMGAVYLATDTQFGNRAVAVKEMSQSNLDPQEVAEAANQFKQEAHLLAGLKHPNLPSIYDHFAEGGRWYLVMDFIEGGTVEERLDTGAGQALPVNVALDIGTQLTKVLGYLHTRPTPIIFRDLKPSNIMNTPEGHIYLIDFGIVRLFKPGKIKDTVAYGSPGYAAPEQFNSEQTSPLSDIYSLGATLHQLLSGHSPRANTPTIFHFEPLQTYNPTLPVALATLVSQMVSMNKSQRPASMAAVRKELENIQKQVQEGVTHYASGYQAQRPVLPTPSASPAVLTPRPVHQPIDLTQQQQQIIQPVQQQQKAGRVRPPLPKHGFLRALLIGVIAGSINAAVAYMPRFSYYVWPWLIIDVIICVAAGALTGKIAVARSRGLFTGIIIGLAFGIIVSVVSVIGNLGYLREQIGSDVLATVIIAVVAGFLSLFGAWLVTRKHPYYVK